MALGGTNLAALYDRYGGLVYRRARRLLGEEQSAKDVCQEVFVKLWQTPPDLENVSTMAWLYKVTTNHCLNLLRDARRRRSLLETRSPRGQAGDVPTSLPLLLRGLPEELHEVAVYYYVDEMSQEEIALVLGCSQRTVHDSPHGQRRSPFRCASAQCGGSPCHPTARPSHGGTPDGRVRRFRRAHTLERSPRPPV